jgi:hypothetical protein
VFGGEGGVVRQSGCFEGVARHDWATNCLGMQHRGKAQARKWLAHIAIDSSLAMVVSAGSGPVQSGTNVRFQPV